MCGKLGGREEGWGRARCQRAQKFNGLAAYAQLQQNCLVDYAWHCAQQRPLHM